LWFLGLGGTEQAFFDSTGKFVADGKTTHPVEPYDQGTMTPTVREPRPTRASAVGALGTAEDDRPKSFEIGQPIEPQMLD
jgi:hypothetical protein